MAMPTPFVAGPGSQHSWPRLAVLLSGPLAIAFGSWIYLGLMITDMSTIPGLSVTMMTPQASDLSQFFGLFVMWAVMMSAMMLPTALPMILAYARMQGSDRQQGVSWFPVGIFSSGYVVAWAGFSLAAAALQTGVTGLALMSPMMMKIIPGPVAGVVLIVAGLYQFTGLKQSCLRQCRTPIGYLMTQWRVGHRGAYLMGWRHGLFCVGCCWALMGLLFVAGVMNSVWILAITLYVFVEKMVPNSDTISRLVGVALVALGGWLLI